MFSSLFGSSDKKEKQEKQEKKSSVEVFAEEIKGWTLTEIRDYIAGNKEGKKPDSDGMAAIIYRFTNIKTDDKNYPNGKKEMEMNDLPQRSQKVMDIVIGIAKGPYVNVRVITEITKFIEVYSDFFKGFDRKNHTIYSERILEAYQTGIIKIEEKNRLDIKAKIS